MEHPARAPTRSFLLSAPLALDGFDHGLQLPFLIPAQSRLFVLAIDEQQVGDTVRRKMGPASEWLYYIVAYYIVAYYIVARNE